MRCPTGDRSPCPGLRAAPGDQALPSAGDRETSHCCTVPAISSAVRLAACSIQATDPRPTEDEIAARPVVDLSGGASPGAGRSTAMACRTVGVGDGSAHPVARAEHAGAPTKSPHFPGTTATRAGRGKAAERKWLHRLEPDRQTADVVRRILAMYLAGTGLYAIAEALTTHDIPSPSAHDRPRNRHRDGIAWSKGDVRAILLNPRYTGHQVWNRQRRDEVLLDVDDVALGHATKLRWNTTDDWIWSTDPVHEALVTREDFGRTQQLLPPADAGALGQRAVLLPLPVPPAEYAIANKIEHPRNVYLREAVVLDPIDTWLAQVFAPSRLTDTLHLIANAADDDHTHDLEREAARRSLAECDQRLARYRAALEAGTDPTLIARWTAEVNAQRAMAEHRLRQASGTIRMTPSEIHNLVTAIGDLVGVLRTADPADKAAVYRHLGLKLTYMEEAHTLQVRSQPNLSGMGFSSCPRPDLDHNYMITARLAMASR
jgi:site-specific DNA recombinase